MSENTVAVTDQSFDTDVVEASKTGPVLVTSGPSGAVRAR
jgi:thioredoxin-like negative regulator of GroEL